MAAPDRPGIAPDHGALAARAACFDVVMASVSRVDSGNATQVPELYTEDGTMVRQDERYSGRTEIAQMMSAREQSELQTLHVITNFQFQLLDEHRAETSSVLTIYDLSRTEMVPWRISLVRDQFRNLDGLWRIESRDVTRFNS